MDSEIDADGTKSTVGNQADNKYQNKTSQTCVLLPVTWSLLSIATNVAFHREKVSLPQPVPGQTVNTISELASFRLAKPNLVTENRSGSRTPRMHPTRTIVHPLKLAQAHKLRT